MSRGRCEKVGDTVFWTITAPNEAIKISVLISEEIVKDLKYIEKEVDRICLEEIRKFIEWKLKNLK